MEAETTLDCNIGEKVTITSPNVTITSPEIDLGGEAVEPLVLGDQLVMWLEALIDEINAISAIPTGAGPSGPVSATAFAGKSAALKQELQQILSEQNKTL